MGSLVAILIALPLQVLGYATTCTQGDSGSAIAGSLFSTPLLILSLALLLRAQFGGPSRPPRAVLNALALVLMLMTTKGIWLNTLMFGTPCGEDFTFYGIESHGWWLIVLAYLVLPIANLMLCLSLGLRSIKRATK